MKDISVSSVSSTVRTNKVHSDPYPPDSDGSCGSSTTVYSHEEANLCCQKCPPGHRSKQECSETSDTQCEPCGSDQYLETWNFSPNCLSCTKCKDRKGLTTSQNCTPIRNSKCVCKSGMYCEIGFDDPYCTDCRRYTECKTGFRVSVKGTRNSDVKCERCPTAPCEPRTTTVMTTVTINTTTPHGSEESTQPVRTYLTPVLKTHERDRTTGEMVAVIAAVTGFLSFLIIVVLSSILCKRKRTRDSGNLPTKVDANGNCETSEQENGHCNAAESQMVLISPTPPEQMALSQKREASYDQSSSSSDTETSTRPDGFSSHESLRPLQPTLGFDNPTSVSSEPRSLQSIADPIVPLPNIGTQSSSQPTSPQIVSPVTNSPHVNVNITLHIGNGSCGTPSLQPTDFNQAEYMLPFGQEEESISSPQQEAGKSSFMSVQESLGPCT